MVFTNKYSKVLIDKFQNFAKSEQLQEAIEYEADGEYVNACTVFTGLTDYVVYELINKNNEITNEEVEIYKYIEDIRKRYSNFPDNTEEKDLDASACSCFLENLINRASAKRISYERFIPYLGEKSREYCRAWDEFTGVKSPGLWDE